MRLGASFILSARVLSSIRDIGKLKSESVLLKRALFYAQKASMPACWHISSHHSMRVNKYIWLISVRMWLLVPIGFFEGSLRFGVLIHGWVVIRNHVHLLMTPTQDRSISGCMQHLGQLYVRYSSYRYKRTGPYSKMNLNHIRLTLCPLCGGTMRVIADIIQKILDHIQVQPPSLKAAATSQS